MNVVERSFVPEGKLSNAEGKLSPEKIGFESVMLSRLQHLVEGFFESSAGIFRKAGLSPNAVTVAGFLLTVAVFLLYVAGLRSGFEIAAAAVLLLLASYFDALDGAMARRYRLGSVKGGILDSVLDRTGEFFLYAGVAVGGIVDFRLALWALSASFLVSYIRARAEAGGMVMKGVGIAERPERMIILLAATIFQFAYGSSLAWGVSIIAVLSSITVIERAYRVSSVTPAQARMSGG